MLWYAGEVVDMLRGRLRVLRSDKIRDLGASAIEWAIIAAISVIIATLIGGIVYKVVDDKGSQLQNCASTAVGDNTTCGGANP